MKVVLPDNTELELADGATGLDAARAIGPKLAEQAVLIRADGNAQDLRAPLADGQAIQILTTRDTQDADALYVLRHSSAHLLAEAVRRLYPGVKIAIGPPIENGFYYDFEFPEPIHEEDLETIEAEIGRELKEGREWTREEISRDDAKARFAAEGEPYKVELVDTAEGDITLYTQGDFTDLCRGPHLQTSKPIKALKLTSIAGAYWRGDSSKQQLTRIYGTAFYTQDDLAAHLEQLEEAKRRDHRRLGAAARPIPLRRGLAGIAVLASEGHGRLERARGPPPPGEREARLHRDQDAAGLREAALGNLGPLGEVPRQHVLHPARAGRGATLRTEADELPGALPRLSTREATATATCRYVSPRLATLHRNEPSGTLHGLLRVRHVTQDDGHTFCTPEQIEDEIFALSRACVLSLRPVRSDDARGAVASAREQARLGRGLGHAEGALRNALRSRGVEFVEMPGEGAFYGPKIDIHMEDSLGRCWQLGTFSSTSRCRSVSASPTCARTTSSGRPQ